MHQWETVSGFLVRTHTLMFTSLDMKTSAELRLGTVNPNIAEKGRARQSPLSMVLSSASLSHSAGYSLSQQAELGVAFSEHPLLLLALTGLERLKHDPLRAVGSRSRCDLSVHGPRCA